MNLTMEFPRSPNDEMAGIVSLPRMIDKTRASIEGTLGEYDVNCPHDKPVLAFLGVDFDAFKKKLAEFGYEDAKVEAWARERLKDRTAADLAAFNAARRAWSPDGHSQSYFDEMREKVAPGRSDVTTWFKLLDLDEHRAA